MDRCMVGKERDEMRDEGYFELVLWVGPYKISLSLSHT